jgi:cytochrome c
MARNGRANGAMKRALFLAGALVVAAGCAGEPALRPEHIVVGGDAALGVDALRRHGCGGCHVIPGVPEARGRVGPSLQDFAGRPYIAGRLTNDAGNLMTWIQTPRAVDPGTLMPDLGVSEAEARDIATYLYTLGAARVASEPTWPPSPPAGVSD